MYNRKSGGADTPARGVAMVGLFMMLISVAILLLAAATRERAAGAVEATASVAEETQTAESALCVAVDAGHGGLDPGTMGGEILEKDINLSVAFKLKERLEEQGVSVLLTRSADREVSLERRVSLANLKKADLFISLHCNYFEEDDSVAGLECYYQPEQTAGETFAENILAAMESDARISARNIKPEDYYVLRNTTMPAVLVELGFLSNPAECRQLSESDYQEILAESLAEGILRELESATGDYQSPLHGDSGYDVGASSARPSSLLAGRCGHRPLHEDSGSVVGAGLAPPVESATGDCQSPLHGDSGYDVGASSARPLPPSVVRWHLTSQMTEGALQSFTHQSGLPQSASLTAPSAREPWLLGLS